MKTLLTIIFTIFSQFCFATNSIVICGSISSSQKTKLKIFQPINGYYNMSFFEHAKSNLIVNRADSFYFKSASTSAVTLLLYITTEDDNFITKSVLVLFPQDSVHLIINLAIESQESIKYEGSNAKGHKLFNDMDYNPVSKYQKVIQVLNREYDNPETFIKDVDNSILGLTGEFDTLLLQSTISQAFSDYNKIVFRQLVYQFVIGKFLNPSKKRDMFKKAERNMIIESFFSKQPVSDPNTKSTYNSFIYMVLYHDFLSYKTLNVSSIAELSVADTFTIKGKQYFIDNECSQFLYIEDKVIQEELWANFMLNLMHKYPSGKFDRTILQFKEIFPASEWNAVLEKHLKGMKASKLANYILQFPIEYIDTVKNVTFVDLLQKLPEQKVVFIDLWASWCGPCLKAFEYNAELDSFLIQQDIIRMYISLDQNETQWKSAISKYALGGYHYLSNDLMTQEIKKIYEIENNVGISIPRYMLVSKDKKVVLNNAMSPVNTSLLKEQIQEFLLR